MDLINKIESLRYDIENGVETDVISISVRLIKIRDQALQLQQGGVSTCFLEYYIDALFGNEITYKQTSCCKIAPITNENYCPNCGNKILK